MNPRLTLAEGLSLVALLLVVVRALGCSSALPAAAPAPTGDELRDLEALLAVAQVSADISRSICNHLAPTDRCHSALDALDAGLVVATSTLEAARTCREQSDAECLTTAQRMAHDHLPELRRLLAAVLGAP